MRRHFGVSDSVWDTMPCQLAHCIGCLLLQVREAICSLDLDVLFLPSPKGGPTWRPQAIERGGKRQFPYMVDENTGTALYESDAIISYLFTTYGDGRVPLSLRLGFLTTLTCGLALAPRLGAGTHYVLSKLPEQPLVYWGYEMSPFCKVGWSACAEVNPLGAGFGTSCSGASACHMRMV